MPHTHKASKHTIQQHLVLASFGGVLWSLGHIDLGVVPGGVVGLCPWLSGVLRGVHRLGVDILWSIVGIGPLVTLD